MKRRILFVITAFLLSFLGAVIAETSGLLGQNAENDRFSMQAAEEAVMPEGLTQREEEIYRAAYANGYYDALHPVYVEGRYVLNTKTKKFHLTNCPSTLMIESQNREYSALTPEELIKQKYKPCGQCHPGN